MALTSPDWRLRRSGIINAPYFLCKELQEGFLDEITGSYRDPEPYFVAMRDPEAFEKYDEEFPPKEKLVLPGQLG